MRSALALVRDIFGRRRPEPDDNGYEHTVRFDGSTAGIFSIRDGGQEITVSGWMWDRGKFKAGDRVLFVGEQCPSGSRYRIVSTEFPRDPDDQYFLRCQFLPRTRNEEKRRRLTRR